MKKGRFLWSAHRITEKQKAGKAENIKEKQLKNSRSQIIVLQVCIFIRLEYPEWQSRLFLQREGNLK